VFVWKDGQFELREVVPGVSDRRHTEILQGLKAGELVAVENAFHLKAEYIKTAAGDNWFSTMDILIDDRRRSYDHKNNISEFAAQAVNSRRCTGYCKHRVVFL
jgi:hypothetical protein